MKVYILVKVSQSSNEGVARSKVRDAPHTQRNGQNWTIHQWMSPTNYLWFIPPGFWGLQPWCNCILSFGTDCSMSCDILSSGHDTSSFVLYCMCYLSKHFTVFVLEGNPRKASLTFPFHAFSCDLFIWHMLISCYSIVSLCEPLLIKTWINVISCCHTPRRIDRSFSSLSNNKITFVIIKNHETFFNMAL